MKQNLVAHNTEGSSNKAYMACIRKDLFDGKLTVVGKWGRQGSKNLKQQVKLVTYNEAAATAEQSRLFISKLKSGYVDIESSEYNGSLTMASPEIASNLEDTGEIIFSPDGDPVPNLNTGEVIVECVDNSGMEDKFDTGIDYVGEYHPDSHGEVYVRMVSLP